MHVNCDETLSTRTILQYEKSILFRYEDKNRDTADEICIIPLNPIEISYWIRLVIIYQKLI